MAASIADRFAINDLLVRYGTARDGGDVDGMVACFTTDGSLESPAVGAWSGHDGIRAFSERFAALNRRGARCGMLSNLAVTGRLATGDHSRHERRRAVSRTWCRHPTARDRSSSPQRHP